MATIIGTAGDDVRTGTGQADVITLLGGNDVGAGVAGDDTIFGGAGDDALDGGRADDLLFGGAGRDSLFGGRGDDHLAGGAGDDRLSGRDGDDALLGGVGRDWLLGGTGSNTLTGGPGVDRFRLSATDEVPLGLTFEEFEQRLADLFTFEAFLIAALADGPSDVITDLGRGERVVVDAGFAVAEFNFTLVGGVDVDGDGDGDGFDILGAITFRSASGEVALKMILLPDQFLRVDFDVVGTDSGVRLDVIGF